MLSRLFKWFLPYGLVQFFSYIFRLKKLGLLDSCKDILMAKKKWENLYACGLYLFPESINVVSLPYIVDVGANIGLWAEAVLGCARPIKIISFEPDPESFVKLRSLSQKYPNLEAHNIVIGDRKGAVSYNITRQSSGASVLQPSLEMREYFNNDWEVKSRMELNMETLDGLLFGLPEVSLLKIDVQGFEGAVLRGARETLKKTRFILIELNCFKLYNDGSELSEIHSILEREYNFRLSNISAPFVVYGRAIYCDGLYFNPNLVKFK